MISEQLRTTLLSLKQISDRLKLLDTTSVTKSEALAYKNEITEALDSIDEKIDDISIELDDVAQQSTLMEGIAAHAKDATVAKEEQATLNKNAIIAAVNSARSDLSTVAKEAAATANKEAIMGGKQAVNTGESIPAITWDGEFVDINGDSELMLMANVNVPAGFGVGSVVAADDMTTQLEDILYVAKAVNEPSVHFDGQDYSLLGVTLMLVEKGKSYRCISEVPLSYSEENDEPITGTLYVYEEYEQGRSVKEVYAVLEALTGGGVEIMTDAEYAAFKSHMETEIANILTPITEE